MWINLDTFFYLRNKPVVDDVSVGGRPRAINYGNRPNPKNKYDNYMTIPASDEATGTGLSHKTIFFTHNKKKQKKRFW